MTRPSALLYILNQYSPSMSSHFAHIAHLLEELANQGVLISLIVEQADAPPTFANPNVAVTVLEPSNALRRWFRLLRAIEAARLLGYRTAFIRISSWSALAAILAMRGRRGRVFFWQSGTTIEFDRSQPWSRRRIRWTFRSHLPSWLVWKACDIFVTGPASMIEYYSINGRVDKRKIRLLFNDVDVERFTQTIASRAQHRAHLRGSLDLPDDAIVMLLVHRLSPVRRTLDYLPLALVEARRAGLLLNTYLAIVGDGGDLKELRRQCVAEGIESRVRFFGDVSNMGIENIYAGSDIFLQPSHAEGFPRVLLEAMASGLPVVSTDAGGTSDVLGPIQQEFIADKDRPDLFSSALNHLLLSSEVWPILADENRIVAQLYDTPVVAQMYRRVLFDE